MKRNSKTKVLAKVKPAPAAPSAYAALPHIDARDVLMLSMILEYQSAWGYSPTMRDFAARLNSSTSIARYRVTTLEKRGLVDVARKNQKIIAHTIRVTQIGHFALEKNAEAEQ